MVIPHTHHTRKSIRLKGYDYSSQGAYFVTICSYKNKCLYGKIIDEEIKKLVDDAEIKCKKILQDNIEELHIVARGLLEYETLTGDEIKDLINGISPSREDFDNESDDEKPSLAPSVPKTSSKISPQPQ